MRWGLLILVLIAGGCRAPMADDTYVCESYAASHYVPPVTDGTTTVAEVTARLGAPSFQAEGGRLTAWRVILVQSDRELTFAEYEQGACFGDPWVGAKLLSARREKVARDGVVLVAGPEMLSERPRLLACRDAEYSLVLVADPRGTVIRHAFRRIPP